MDTYPIWPNLAAMMFDRARRWPDKPMLRDWRDGAWHSTTWGEFARLTASCARALRAAGVSAGDRVLICSENRPEYPIAETALMAIRAVPVPAYVTNTPDDHAPSAARFGRAGRHRLDPGAGRAGARGGAALGRRAGYAGGDGCARRTRSRAGGRLATWWPTTARRTTSRPKRR